jgi:hypothetical protein
MHIAPVRRYGSFLITGKASQISAQLARMAARERGRVPSFDPETCSTKRSPRHEDDVATFAVPPQTKPVSVPQYGSTPVLLEGV